MEASKARTLVEAAPNFFSHDPSRPSPFSQRGFEVSDGWFEIVSELARKVEQVLLEMPEEQRRAIRCSQVKEKFGGLRVYVDGPAGDVIHSLIRAAEDLSWRTCESCGAAGERRQVRGYLFVACDRHYEEERRRRR